VDHVPKAWTVAGCVWFTSWKSLGEHFVPRPTVLADVEFVRKLIQSSTFCGRSSLIRSSTWLLCRGEEEDLYITSPIRAN